LKNENNALPLNKNEKVLLIGEAANNLIFQNGAWTHTWQGEDTSHNTKGNSTIYQALSQKLGDKLTFIQGYDLKSVNGWESCSTLDIEKVKSAAQQSDKIIICLGEMPATEKPGDVKTLNLCEEQQQLVKELQSIGKPVILVLLFGKPHIIREIEPKSEAILHAYLPGDYGSEALSEIILGEANPSGKLPFTYPRFDGVIEYYDYVNSETKTNKTDGLPINPQWAFGHGLSYTNFSFSDLLIKQLERDKHISYEATITVKNTGDKTGKEVVQWYITDEYASVTPANKKLKGFEKISLSPGESKKVVFKFTTKELRFIGEDNKWMVEPGTFRISCGDQSSSFELK
jgi:beta-glucosidase